MLPFAGGSSTYPLKSGRQNFVFCHPSAPCLHFIKDQELLCSLFAEVCFTQFGIEITS